MVFILQMKKTTAQLMSQSKWVGPGVIQGCLTLKPYSFPNASLRIQTRLWQENPQRMRTVIHSCIFNVPAATSREAGCESLGWAGSGLITVY